MGEESVFLRHGECNWLVCSVQSDGLANVQEDKIAIFIFARPHWSLLDSDGLIFGALWIKISREPL